MERDQRIEHEALQSLSHQQIGQRVLKRRRVVTLDQGEDVALERRCCAFAAWSGARIGERVQLDERAAHQLARPHAGIHQPLDRAELGDLLWRVQAFGVVVA